MTRKASLFLLLCLYFISSLQAQRIDSSSFEIKIENGDTTIVETIHYDYSLQNLANFEGLPAPDFDATDMNNKKHSLIEYRNQVVILYFCSIYDQSTWDDCKSFQRLHEEYFDKGLVLLGLCNDDAANVHSFLTKRTATYPIIPNCFEFGIEHYGGEKGNPRVFVIDKMGIIRATYIGGGGDNPMKKYDAIQPILEELLKE